jgi:hypothetical protein
MALVPKYRVLDNKFNDTKQFLIKPIDHCVIGQKQKKTSKITIYINPTLGPTVKDTDTKVGINVCLNNAEGWKGFGCNREHRSRVIGQKLWNCHPSVSVFRDFDQEDGRISKNVLLHLYVFLLATKSYDVFVWPRPAVSAWTGFSRFGPIFERPPHFSVYW